MSYDLIFFSSVGAFIGDYFSFFLGKRGIRFFNDNNKILKSEYLEKGKSFFGKHGNRLGITTSHSCRSCGDTDEGETTEHFLCSCPALASLRLKTLGNYFFDSPIEMSRISIKDLMCFINGTKCFTKTDST